MSEGATLSERLPERARLERVAEWLAIAVAVSLPWSTSATGILIALWLLAFIPTLALADLRQGARIPAAALPAGLWALGLIGMLWADASFAERFSAFKSFHKLLVIPLLLVQFRRSDHGPLALGAFLVSCAGVLAVSWAVKLWPSLPWPFGPYVGVPVKDHITQSAEFLICAFALGHLAIDAWQRERRAQSLALASLALLFLANIAFVATARTSLVVLPILLVLLAFQRFRWRGIVAVLLIGLLACAAAWLSSPNLRARTLAVVEEIEAYRTHGAATSAGYRLEFWKKSLDFVASAPLVGHGTGSIAPLFRRAAEGHQGMPAVVTGNPHNQTLIVAIQLGLFGVGVLYAMWIAHLFLFRGWGLASWIGLGVVIQNIVSSMFSSQLFEFTTGWIYVFGIGILGGMALSRQREPAPREQMAALDRESSRPLPT